MRLDLTKPMAFTSFCSYHSGKPARFLVEFNSQSSDPDLFFVAVDVAGVYETAVIIPKKEVDKWVMNTTVKKAGWVNLYEDNAGEIITGGGIFPSKEEARVTGRCIFSSKEEARVVGHTQSGYITTVPIVWEE